MILREISDRCCALPLSIYTHLMCLVFVRSLLYGCTCCVPVSSAPRVSWVVSGWKFAVAVLSSLFTNTGFTTSHLTIGSSCPCKPALPSHRHHRRYHHIRKYRCTASLTTVSASPFVTLRLVLFIPNKRICLNCYCLLYPYVTPT